MRHVQQGLHLGFLGRQAVLGHVKAQEVHGVAAEERLLRVGLEPACMQHLQHALHMLQVLLKGVAVDEDVVDEYFGEGCQPCRRQLGVHNGLECRRARLDAEWSPGVAVQYGAPPESSQVAAGLVQWQLEETTPHVELREELGLAQLLEKVVGIGYVRVQRL